MEENEAVRMRYCGLCMGGLGTGEEGGLDEVSIWVGGWVGGWVEGGVGGWKGGVAFTVFVEPFLLGECLFFL